MKPLLHPTFQPLTARIARIRRVAISFLLAGSGTLMAATPRSDWNIVDYIPFEQGIIQGHRGVGNVMSFATDHPDVTLREIRAAYYTARKTKKAP